MPLAQLRTRLDELTLLDEHRLGRRLEKARRHPEDEQALARLDRDFATAEQRVARRRAAVPEITYPPALPVSARRDELLEAIRDNQVVVVAGETGSGKTTQLPKMCLELGRGVRGAIAHTQPRRLAARTVAQRIADELRVDLGEAVGYSVRFNDRSGEDTLVRLVTDGLLLAEVQRDPLLRRYDTIIIDEAHERSLNIDFLLGYLQRLLPRRPDLKLIITSATIDPGQFSRHFGDAPVVEVSGRTFPVEVRYRPTIDPERPEAGERDQLEAIGDAVEELMDEARDGDVLVFLSGEREIRDTADALRGRLRDGVEILPLYARLSAAEQQRVFQGHRDRRVVLATNVAETSLTVPGIKYVVDPGFARMSRYSARLKVQRLPIEPVSQASADQRKGRCGRTSDGICIRLYSDEDFLERPRFTDPEILRTNLASVILQMASLDLGTVADFPFLDAPDPRQVRDGVNLLHELGAIDPKAETAKRLTGVGRKLARLPVDPRMARMILEADRLSCVDEVIVIAAALSIQDPRERPVEHRAHADQLHARFADEHSDFLAYLNLYNYVREQQRELSGSQFRKRMKGEYLHFLRIREWQDLVAQLRSTAKELGITRNQQPGDPQHVHVALLSGLLSHIGVKDTARREYLGARGARFNIFPGSVLAKKQPSWVMVSELVETARLFGRTAARIQPEWVEPLAGHLVKRTYSEPRWERRRGGVVATERVTLYGLPIVAGRKVPYARIDPDLARDLFIRRALVERDWDTRHAFFAANGKLLEEIDALEQRERRRDIMVDDQALYDFLAARIPESVVSGEHFDRWWKEARRADPELLTYTHELLVAPQAASALAGAGRPAAWRQGELVLPLTYRFEPGAEHDGVTVHIPLDLLPSVRATGFDWLVPAFREELVTTLIRSLPKELRRPLVPVPETAALAVERMRPRSGPLLEVLGRELAAMRGVPIGAAAWDPGRLPAHLRVTFSVEDEAGAVLASGHDLAAVREKVKPRLRAALSAATAGLEHAGLTAWTIGDLPREITLPGTGEAVRAYPALVDEGATVAVRMLESRAAQEQAMRAGTRRLLLLTIPSPARHVQGTLGNQAQLLLAAAPHGSLAAVLDDATVAAADALIDEAGGPAWDAAGFARLRDHVAGELATRAANVMKDVVAVLGARADLHRRMETLVAEPLRPARQDVAEQLGGLVYPGFVAASGAARLPDVLRYLRAAERRLERLPDVVPVDRDRMAGVRELEAELRARTNAYVSARRPVPAGLREAAWMLQELRVSHFAQALGVHGQVSAKRIRRLMDDAAPRT
ncbi:MAG TPA: ATP-dependent RNA helicase HrpA [Baekduia sp.]|uniref:ATP-dependent RNA helicase HrpA n=1 Tax=Baekduia sp. TaxID=2600305 RepID=UPI002CE10476|nr:ATP-dependent RNA helicase HrpA [Baekduia sp.]HMJ37613.1 ATP-dependent RNA helicase HrpA [Baekduia sp.]